ncbi:MAG: lytic transglycosylase domain-containing protein [Candidatus Acidiferrales bacterium]
MTRNELIALAKQTAEAHGLFGHVICGQIERESSWDPWTIRYEGAFFARYIQPMLAAGKLHDATEARARAISWGLGQVMGEVARELGYAGRLAALCDPAAGVEWQCRALDAKLRVQNGNVRDALQAYNGGANPSYADEVLQFAEKYKTPR